MYFVIFLISLIFSIYHFPTVPITFPILEVKYLKIHIFISGVYVDHLIIISCKIK